MRPAVTDWLSTEEALGDQGGRGGRFPGFPNLLLLEFKLLDEVCAAIVSDTIRRMSSAVRAALAVAVVVVFDDADSEVVVEVLETGSGVSLVRRLLSSSRRICCT